MCLCFRCFCPPSLAVCYASTSRRSSPTCLCHLRLITRSMWSGWWTTLCCSVCSSATTSFLVRAHCMYVPCGAINWRCRWNALSTHPGPTTAVWTAESRSAPGGCVHSYHPCSAQFVARLSTQLFTFVTQAALLSYLAYRHMSVGVCMCVCVCVYSPAHTRHR